jgi:class II vitamin B12-dependent ribonucleotide reductase
LRVARRYTSDLHPPYRGVGFRAPSDREPRCRIPESWPETAGAIFSQCCAGRDSDARQSFDRLAGELTRWGWDGGYFDMADDAAGFFDELRFMLCHRLVAPDLALWSAAGAGNEGHGAPGCENAFVTDYRSGRVVPADARHAANRSDRSWSVAVFNLGGFAPGDAQELAHAARLWTMALDISIHLTARATRRAAERDWSRRPIGLETVGATDNSSDALVLISRTAREASAEIAAELGAAPGDGDGGMRNLDITVTRSRRDAARLLEPGIDNSIRHRDGVRHGRFVVHDGGVPATSWPTSSWKARPAGKIALP